MTVERLEAARSLRSARALIEDPEFWIKDASEEDGARCAMGALDATPGGMGRHVAYTTLRALAEVLGYGERGGCPVAALNDAPETTHADVLALYDLAIERAEAAS